MMPLIEEALQTAKKCRIFGVGLNLFGTAGQAHGVYAPLLKGKLQNDQPLQLSGASGIATFDSGGGLVCNIEGEDYLVAINSRGNGLISDVSTGQETLSIFALLGTAEIYPWLSQVVQSKLANL